MAEELIKIPDLPAGTPADTDVVPFVDLATNTTKKALKSELKGDTGLAATADAGTTTTLSAGQSATVTNVGTPSAAIFNFAIPQGIQGITGDTGAKVTSVAFSGNDIVFTLDDASTVTLTDAKTDLKGDTGLTGANGATGAKIVSASFVGDDMVFTLDDSTTVTLLNAKITLKGSKGDTGPAGTITSIVKTNTVGLVDTYTVTYNDNSTTTFTVTNGQDGTGAGDMLASVYDPVGKASQVEVISNKKTDLSDNSDTFYPSQKAVKTAVDGKQATLVSATNIKTINSISLLGSGNINTPNTEYTASSFDIKDLTDSTSLRSSWTGKQNALGFTPENVTNKVTAFSSPTDTQYPSAKLVKDQLDGKQASGSYLIASDITGKEDTSNKSTDVNADAASDTKYPSVKAVKSYADTKADKPNEVSVATATSITPSGSYKENEHKVTALTSALTINAPSSPSDGNTLLIRINSASAQTLTFNAIYDFIAEKPTETPAGETLYIGAIYNSTKPKWEVTSVNNK